MPGPVLFCSDVFWDESGDEVVAIDPTIEVVRLIGDERVPDGDLERITIAFYSVDLWPGRSRPFMGACLRAPELAWLHSMSAGTDHPVFAALRDRGVTVTSSAGSSAPSIAQTVMLYLLALGRDLPRLQRAQAAKRWAPGPVRDLHGMRLAIVGLGSIGREVAWLAGAFGMEIVGVRRTVRGDEPCETRPSDELDDVLGWADAVAVTAPLTEETRGLFDAGRFARMRPGAWFVNVGRGEIVDEEGLVAALTDGPLGGAALDVFATEPLPPASEVWTLPNVIVTPHQSGASDRTRRRAVEMFLDNLRRHRDGHPLHHVT